MFISNSQKNDLISNQSPLAFFFFSVLQYVETLQEQLADLENSDRIHPEYLQAYRERTTALSNSLHRAEMPDLCRLLVPLQSAAAGVANDGGIHPGTTSTTTNTQRPGLPIPLAVVPRTIVPLSARDTTAVVQPPSSSSSRPEAPLQSIALSEAAKARIDAQGRAQEALTDELADLAAAMKSNTLAMEAKVKERGVLLNSAENALEKSAGDTKTAATKATAIHRRGRLNFCFTCLVLFIIGTGFAAMYLFIRITSITGYRNKVSGVKVVGLPSPPPPPPLPLPDDDPFLHDGVNQHVEF